MKKIFTILLLLAAFGLDAQVYNNEWIDFSKTYYKFKVGSDGLYRIPQSVIANAGLGNTPAEYFQLFRNGQEVPIYTSVASGPLGSADYIEFWGRMNDGKADKSLYLNPAYQHTTHWSLETDTATYFLTVNSTAATFHYVTATNDTTGNILPVEPYFMHKTGTYFKQFLNPGYAQIVGEYIYSSSYDMGEFWSTQFIYPVMSEAPTAGNPDVQNNLFVYNGGPANATLRFGAVGCSDNPRTFGALINNTPVADSVMNSFNDLLMTVSFPVSLISSGSATVLFQNNCVATNLDRTVVSFYEITYPRQFNFNGQSNFYFDLAAKPAGYYLNITNFNAGSATPVLYDLTNGARYTAIVGAGTLYFKLPGSASLRRMVLVSEDPSNVNTVNSLTTKNFINFANTGNQGNYLIISNPLLYTGGTGTNPNPVIEYQQYRSSAAGGGFNASVIDINELVDQFAFGIKMHPFSIKNFLSYARKYFAIKPQYVLLIGHGITYDEFNGNQSDPNSALLELVPTFGYPASDNKLSSPDVTNPVPVTPIGRISVISGAELDIYLQKVIEYENVQHTAANTIADRGWMKNVLHVTGASDPYLGEVLCQYMNNYAQIIQDTLFGGVVTTFCKATPTEIDQVSNQQITQLFSTGFSILNYFGHSSASTLAYNLNDPNNYSNQGKYPVFYVNGCDAGNFFTYDLSRVLSTNKTLSETYVLAKDRGSIAFVASTSFGIVNYLNILINGLYNLIAHQDYGKSLGTIQVDALQNLVNAAPGDFYAKVHAEEMTLHGDPALKINNETLPDFAIEAPQVVISPSFISVADTSFTVNMHIWNLGKYVNDSVLVIVTRQYPNGTTGVIFQKRVSPIETMDSLLISVPIVAARDKGQNYINIIVNADNSIPEVTTANNSVRVGVYVYVDEARPVFPYNYAIVNTQNQKLFASTADPLAPSAQYIMEIDTTGLFNSPSLISKTITSPGGLLQFDPGISYRDSTVYYWRVSIVPAQGAIYHWDEYSFIYLSNSTPGFNQSHYYQHAQSATNEMFIDSASRAWKFGVSENALYIPNALYPTGGTQQAAFTASINGNAILGPGCNYNEIIFNVIDPITFQPWLNNYTGPTGLYNSEKATCGSQRQFGFDFLYTNSTERKKGMDFMDSLPNGAYVIARFNVAPPGYGTNIYINQWMADTSIYGSNNSLYHRFLQAGCLVIDSFTSPKAIAFLYKKGDPTFIPLYTVTQGIYDVTSISTLCASSSLTGSVTSPLFGPAKQWTQLHWSGKSIESPSTDSVTLQIIGTDTSNNQAILFSLTPGSPTYDISSISAKQYPYLQLKMSATDSVHGTPYQLQYWRLNYVPIPEGAIAPNIYLTSKDTLQLGEKLEFAVAFKNISAASFDSLKIMMTVLDHNNVSHVLQLPKKRPLVSGDTLIVAYELDTKSFPGLNTLYVDVNPNYDQPEQFLFNNFMYRNFFVKTDQTNPLLDVTFDGVHILNQDIVSAKPHITIKLTDESKYLLLTDTSLIKVQVRYPDGSLHNYSFSSDTLRFTPATSGTNNVATIDFYPTFTNQVNPQGDQYTLYVTGKDESGNPAAVIQYQISFTVITKAMISNMLNYPNPFTTSTAFVFTITGSQVPQNIKIQILTITGKIVKEITEDELGPLHVGRNITEYKWNGTDMYGQKLANGVYIYHVVTNLNGKSLDKYQSQSDNTDQYFTKGYGKMYLMR
jgi:peptidase C25-like protein